MASNDRVNSLEAAAEQCDLPVFIATADLDPPGPEIIYANEAVTRMTGYTRDELAGATPRIFQGPATERAELDRLKTTLRTGEPYEGCTWNYRKDGTAYRVQWTITPLRLGGEGVDYHLAVQRDVTEQDPLSEELADETRRMNALLQAAWLSDRSPDLFARLTHLINGLEAQTRERTREAESARDHFQSILNSSPVGIAFLNHHRCIQRVNPAFEDLMSRSTDELVGSDSRYLYRDQSEFERVGREAYAHMAAGGIYHTVTTLERGDGVPITVSLKGQAVTPSGDEGFIWVFQDITRQRARERRLQAYQAIFESSRDAEILDTEDEIFAEYNPAALALFELPDRTRFAREYAASDLSPTYQPDGRSSREAARTYVQQAFEQGHVFFEWEHRTTTGKTFPTEVLLSRVDLDDGPILKVSIRDVTDKKAAFEELREARDRAETYFEAVPVMVMVIDLAGLVTAINQRGCELLALSREAINGSNWLARFIPSDETSRMREALQALRDERSDATEYMESTIVTASGDRRMIAFRNALLRDIKGKVAGYLVCGVDITKQRQIEADLDYRAAHDPLTGLYNRRRFTEMLHAEIQRSQRYKTLFSVIMFDIDHFKIVNDRYGHDVGDEVLRELTALAAGHLRDVDRLGRWGGEEFLALLPETDLAEARQVAATLRVLTAETDFTTVGNVTISLGVASITEGETMESLIKRADDNLYAAKNSGRNRVV